MDRVLTRSQAAALGLFAIVALLLGGVAAFKVGANHGMGSETFTLETSFPNVQGIRIGTRVRVLGIPAGEVEAVEAPLAPGEPVVVRFWVGREHAPLIRSDASVRLHRDGLVGERLLEIEPGTATAEAIAAGARIASTSTPDWDGLIAKAEQLVETARSGNGAVGKLLNDDELYRDATKVVRRAEDMLGSLDENLSNAKQNWMVQKLLKDRYQLLVRPDSTTHRRVFAATDLFEKNSAILTESGRTQLDEAAAWIREFDETKAEVLIAGFAPGEPDHRLADLLSQKQADSVRTYLVDKHDAHKTGWFQRRTITAHGFGNLPDPAKASESATDRIEILAFTK